MFWIEVVFLGAKLKVFGKTAYLPFQYEADDSILFDTIVHVLNLVKVLQSVA